MTNPIHSHVPILIHNENNNGLGTLQKLDNWGKSGSWVMVQKPPDKSRMQDSINYNISQMSWGTKLNFLQD